MKFTLLKKLSSRMICMLVLLGVVGAMMVGCSENDGIEVYRTQDQLQGELQWTMGFGRCEIRCRRMSHSPITLLVITMVGSLPECWICVMHRRYGWMPEPAAYC